ncbi:MAG TPA: choice-of-anchor B family protein [Longimicrobiales bacterium]|nr:choice-of-anchor B family protein [Longimicrobiales bacterium]
MSTMVNRSAALLLPLLVGGPLAAQSYAGAPGEARAGFGTAVAVGDGVVFVGEGENRMRPGMVYVYRPGARGAWSEAGRLTAPGAERGDGFGRALAAEGGVLLVGQVRGDGADAVHVFTRSGERWQRTGALPSGAPADADFGGALAMAGDVAVVGAPSYGEGTGRAYVFRRGSSGWQPAGELGASDARPGDRFGMSVAIDRDRILVGAPARSDGAGVAYVFRRAGTGQWTEEARLTTAGIARGSGFGRALSLSADRALVAVPGLDQAAGAVVEFHRDAESGEWSEARRLLPFDAEPRSRFGTAVAARGDDAYIGAPGSGAAGVIYVFRGDESGEWSSANKLVAPMVAEGGSFGSTVALGEDLAVAGATGEDFGAGAAVILRRGESAWQPVAKVASEPESLPAVTGAEVRCEGGEASAFDCSAVDLQAFLPVKDIGGARGVRLNDVWGWTDPSSGREYAIVGRIDGTSFVDISDPSNPRYLGDLPMTEGSNTAVWRDMKVYANHAFIVADGAGQHGMQVFDLTRLRDLRDAPATFDEDALYTNIASAHNIVVDTASGFAFAVGARGGGVTCGGGLHMIDVRDPKSPSFAGCFADAQTGRASTGYSHDAQCVTYDGPDEDYRGRQICLAANETALSIADVTDKDNPVAVSRAAYPNVGYTHQGWLTEDQRYFFMNDELDELQGKVSRTRTLVWDVTDLDDPQLVTEFMGTTEASDHNLYIRGNTMYQSNYQAGLRVIDISDPENPREVGYFDTVPYGENAAGFGGSWSNYPYFPSGTIVVTSGNEGLFILKKRGPVS